VIFCGTPRFAIARAKKRLVAAVSRCSLKRKSTICPARSPPKRRRRPRRLGGDEHGQVIDVLLRDKSDRASAEAFFRRALACAALPPTTVITDHHQPYVKAVATGIPLARHVRTGLHRHRGYTTQPVERSHVPTRDRLRGARGLRTVHTGQRFVESFEALPALRRGMVNLRPLRPRYRRAQASVHEITRAIVVAINVLGSQLKKAA
jgi:hypothetical protein